MGATVGSLLVDMALNTASFASDLGKAKGAVDSWAASHNQVLSGVVNSWRGVTKEVGSFIDEAFSLKTALLGLVGGGMLGELVKSNLESATALVHHAEAIGITTDALQEYQYVAKIAGVSSETLTGAMEKFGKQLGQVQAGTGTLFTYLKKTDGVLLDQVVHAGSVGEAFEDVIKRMGEYDTEQAKLGLSAAAFSKGGLEMVNIANMGTDAFNELKQKALDLGIVVSGDLLQNAKAAQEQIETLEMVLRSKLMVAIISNSQEIGNFADAVINAIPAMAKFLTSVLSITTSMFDWHQHVLEVDKDMIMLAGFAGEAAMAVSSIFKGGATTDDMLKWAEATKKAIADVDSQLKTLHSDTAASSNAASDALDNMLSGGKGKGSVHVQDMAANLQAQADAADEAEKAYEKLEEQAKKTFESTRTPLEKYNEAQATLNQELEAGLIDQDTYNRAIEQAGVSMQKAQDKGSLYFDVMKAGIHGQITSWQSLAQVVLKYAQDLLTTLATGEGKTGGLGGGLGIGSALGGIGTFFGAGQLPWQQSPASSMFSGASSWVSSFFHSGGIVGSSGGASRRVDASVFSGAPRFHSGGLVGGEVPAILQKGEQVLTKQQQAAMGNGGDTYYIDARGADPGMEQRLTALITSLNNSVENRAVAAVQNARFRNPKLFGGS